MNRRIKSFQYAIQGLILVVRSEINMRIHIFSAILVLIAGYFLQISMTEWALVFLCFAMVFAAEIGNTVVEKYLNAYHPEHSKIVGDLKDMAAAAVLVIAIFAALIGLMIFIPKIIPLL